MGKRKIHRRPKLSPMQIIAVVFAAIILAGALLLSLPAASRDGQSAGFLSALFTSTSATCVTGLVLFDTASQWSTFGRIVIITLIEVGGLGFISAASMAVFLFQRRVGLRQRMLMAQTLSVDDMSAVVKLQKWVICGSLGVEFVGALILMLRFLPEYGIGRAAAMGAFHSISAFCNAGFDIFGTGQSLVTLNADPVVLITLMVLITVGGLGFFVWEEVVRLRSFKKFSIYTKLVLLTTGILTVIGAVLIMLLEWNNPATLGAMQPGQKVLNAFFQSVTLRTAGFAAVDQGALTGASKGLSLVLMLIGGSSGSTAGGAKTVTFLVLLLFVWNRARGRSEVTVFRRSIPAGKILDAVTIISLMTGLAVAGAVLICATSPVGFTDALFETVSALATVGLTTGVTTSLSIAGKILIIVFMYFGRVGILTLSLGFLMGDRAQERYRYAYTNLLIG